MTERPQRHVYINENTHVKYGETNEKQGFCLTCGQFSPCPHNTLIDQYEAWEKKNPRLERLDEQWLKTQIDNFFPAFEGELGAHNKAQLRKCILEKLNHPNDADGHPKLPKESSCLWDGMPETSPGSGIKMGLLSCPCQKCRPIC